LAEEDVRHVADGAGGVGARQLHPLGLELVEAERPAGARHVWREEGMKADWEVELLARPPDRVVDGIVELLAVDGRIGTEEHADQAELPGATDDADSTRHV